MAKQNGFQNGMQGVFLTAAELTYRGFIVSLTARNAYGADLLVTDGRCKRTWSVQVKTNQSTSASFWLLSSKCESLVSDTHVYVFVALKGNQRPKFLAVPSHVVAKHIDKEATKSGVWYSYWRGRVQYKEAGEGWEETFGAPVIGPAVSEASESVEVLPSTQEKPAKEPIAKALGLIEEGGEDPTSSGGELPKHE